MKSFHKLAESLALTAEDFEELVHNIYSERASLINNEGLDGQLEFLLSDYCNNSSASLEALLKQVSKEKQDD